MEIAKSFLSGILLVAFASASFTSTTASAPPDDLWLYQVTHAEYEQIRELCAQIMAKYPPDEYLYVGLGRSPTPLIAYFQEFLGKNHALHLPIGGLNYTDAEDLWNKPSTRSLVVKHFDAFFPKPHVIKGRKLLVLDYASSGRSLQQSRKLLKNYFEVKRRTPTLRFLGLYGAPHAPTTRPPPEIRELRDEEFERAQRAWIVDQPMNYRVPPELADGSVDLLPAPEMLAKKMNLSLYEDYAEYRGHTFDGWPLDPTPRAKYQTLRGTLKKWIRKDRNYAGSKIQAKLSACAELWRNTFRGLNSK